MSKQAEPQLQDIQAWLHTFVVAPGNSEQALSSAESKAGLPAGSDEDLILPSPTLSPRERIEIYRGMYLLRMQEALEIDFPAVLSKLGKNQFHALVARYVEAYPSQSYTLDHLGKQFSNFLRDAELEEGAFLSELAELEWSLCMKAIAPNSSVLNMEDLASVAPENFVQLVFTTVPAFELLSFHYNVNELYREWGRSEKWGTIEESESHLVVWRQELDLWRLDLDSAQFCFLSSLAQGDRLGEALDLVIEGHNVEEEQCFEWFQNWLSEGFFSQLQVKKSS